MFDWLRRKARPSDAGAVLAPAQLECLTTLLEKLGTSEGRCAERALRYVLEGADGAILEQLAASSGLGAALGLKVSSQGHGSGAGCQPLCEPVILDPNVYLRLARVFEAASRRDPRRLVLTWGQGVPAWLEILLWEASTFEHNTWRGREAVYLSHDLFEALLTAANEPPDALLRLVVFPELQSRPQYGDQRIPDAVPGLAGAAQRHPATVRAALAGGSAKNRAHATQQLSQSGLSPLQFFDDVARLALDSAKTVREAAEAWLGSARDEVSPLLDTFVRTCPARDQARAEALRARFAGPSASAPSEEPSLPPCVAKEPAALGRGARAALERVAERWLAEEQETAKQRVAQGYPVPPPIADEMKELGKTLREVTRAQLLRVENLLVRQRRWPAHRFDELFLTHPLLVPFAVRLVWASYDASGRRLGTFRALEDRSLTTVDDDAIELDPAVSVGIVHPLELDDAERAAWRTHLADNEIDPPFPQLERPVVRANEAQRALRSVREYSGTKLNALTFRGRAERLGWTRGSVTDGGGVNSYMKYFPAAGVDVLLGIENLFMGAGMDDEVTLNELRFVKSGSLQVGSYVYDEPTGDSDERVVSLRGVPPIAFSEALGDVKRIAGRTGDGDEEQ